MNVSRDRLSVIGKLIGIYREERRGNTQNSFTLKKFCEGICSINTLKNIEAGGYSRSEDVYIELLSKLDLKFGEFTVIDEALGDVLENLYEAIEFYDSEDIRLYLDKGINVLKTVDNYVYYSDLLSIFESTKDYYINDSLYNHDFKHLASLLDIFPYKFKDLIRINTFARIQHKSFIDFDEYKTAIDSLKIEESKNVCVSIMLLHYYFVTGEYLQMNKLLNTLEMKFISDHNYIRLLDVYNYGVLLGSYVDKKELTCYVNKIEELIEVIRFPRIKLSEVYANIASSFHYNEVYDNALLYFEKMLEISNVESLSDLIIMADCQNRLDKEINVYKVTKDVLEKNPFEMRKMYNYFTWPKDIPDFVRQNYILKEIAPVLNDQVFIKIFRYEINRLVEQTNHYKSLYMYDKIVSGS